MKFGILYVAYPLLPVSAESAGGAEQVLFAVESGMAARGHSTTVAACEGSSVTGELFATGSMPDEPDRFEERRTEHNTRIVEFIWQQCRAGNGFDLVHDKSGHFWRCASAVPVPVLVTLHLPRHFYAADFSGELSQNLFFNCVSRSQARTFADVQSMVGVVENGIDLKQFPCNRERSGREYLLWIGRICEEKGTHLAIEAAERAGMRLIIVGQVYPFSYHQTYFSREVLPRMERANGRVRYVATPRLEEKIKILQGASALLVPSLVGETSSLVAMEAMACGTPVVAMNRGALPEVVEHGRTGFVVDSPEEMAAALERLREISPSECRKRVEERYDSRRMVSEYEALYSRVLALHAEQQLRAA